MKILLARNVPESAALLEALKHSHDHKITHCPDGTRAILELLANGYDWALIDGNTMNGNNGEIAHIIRAMSPGMSAGHTATGPMAACGVEWSREGVLQLRCCMHDILRGNAPARPRQPFSPDGFCFEYSAPCNKERKHHG